MHHNSPRRWWKIIRSLLESGFISVSAQPLVNLLSVPALLPISAPRAVIHCTSLWPHATSYLQMRYLLLALTLFHLIPLHYFIFLFLFLFSIRYFLFYARLGLYPVHPSQYPVITGTALGNNLFFIRYFLFWLLPKAPPHLTLSCEFDILEVFIFPDFCAFLNQLGHLIGYACHQFACSSILDILIFFLRNFLWPRIIDHGLSSPLLYLVSG